MKKFPILSTVALIFVSAQSITIAENWPQFRGPDGNSVADGQHLPATIDPAKPLWKTALPSGHSSPTVWVDRIFITAYDDQKVWMIGLDRETGDIVWRKSRAMGQLPRYAHEAASPAIATPATNGEVVVFQFGDVGVIATDLDGKELWEKPILVVNDMFGFGSSPIIVGEKLIINADGGVPSALYCLDVMTGDEIWSVDRSSFAYPSYNSPHIWERSHGTEVLQAGGTQLWSYDIETGDVLWNVGNLPSLMCPTPTTDDEWVYAGGWATMHVSGTAMIESIFPPTLVLTDQETTDPAALIKRFDSDGNGSLSREELPPSRARDAFNFLDSNTNDEWEFKELKGFYSEREPPPGRNVFMAIKPTGSGDITESDVKWELRKNLPYVSSPLVYQNRLYLVKKGGTISCLNPETGDAYFERKRLGAPGEYFASPIGIDGKVLVPSERGVLVTLNASEEFEVLSKIDFGEKLIASPAIVDNHLYLRTDQHLYAF